jgi:Abnormal spindle-like microcephaly-assoc'd, ASPM-SPD-2-Hydin
MVRSLRTCIRLKSSVDASKGLKCLLGVVLAIAVLASGCAGVATGSSTSGSSTSSSNGPVLSASTGALDFGNVLVDSTGSLGIVLTNTGNESAIIGGVVVTGSGFTASGVGANTTVRPGETAALNVTFTPSSTGSIAGTLTIASNAGNLSIKLVGSGGQLSSRSVAVSWDPSTSEVIGYYVYRMLLDGTYAKINNAPVVLTEFTDTRIQSGQTYTYVVTAVDADNVESLYSEPATATIP